MDSRSYIRSQIWQVVAAIPKEEKLAASKKVVMHLLQEKVFLKAQNIACYSAKDSEMPTQPIIEAIWTTNKNCYLPVMVINNKTLQFAAYLRDDSLQQNSFLINEPLMIKQSNLIDSQSLDLVIVPLRAFDADGNRLGSGGGYYDRTFSFLNVNKSLKKPLLYGLGFSCQFVSQIEPKNTDVVLDAVITEEGVQKFSNR